jgi:hypothetical protein
VTRLWVVAVRQGDWQRLELALVDGDLRVDIISYSGIATHATFTHALESVRGAARGRLYAQAEAARLFAHACDVIADLLDPAVTSEPIACEVSLSASLLVVRLTGRDALAVLIPYFGGDAVAEAFYP